MKKSFLFIVFLSFSLLSSSIYSADKQNTYSDDNYYERKKEASRQMSEKLTRERQRAEDYISGKKRSNTKCPSDKACSIRREY